MRSLTTRVTASGVLAIYAGRARIGYVTGGGDQWHWELALVSEQMRGHPQGVATSQEAALDEMVKMLERWMDAAGMEWRT